MFGLQAKAVGVWVPNEVIADYVKQHPEKLEGWASVDPTQPDHMEQLDYCVNELGLKGLKLGPVYQHFDPQDRKYWPLFKSARSSGCRSCGTRARPFPAGPSSTGGSRCSSKISRWTFRI